MPLINESDRKSCAESDLNSKLFAHIHSDARLVGTNLEGNVFSNTAGYVRKVLDYTITQPCGLSDKVKSRIQKAIQKTEKSFSRLLENERLYKATIASNAAQKDARVIDRSIQKAADEIVGQLSKDNTTTFPGGWVGKPSGHAMGYKLIKDPKTGKTIFLVYNTGSGIDNHLQKTTSKDKFVPVMAYELPPTVTRQELSQLVKELIKPQIIPALGAVDESTYVGNWVQDQKYDADRVYKEAIKKVGFLGGVKVDPRKYSRAWTQSQLSGTCSMRVLMPMLYQSMKGEAFQQFIYQFRLQSILDYFRAHHKKWLRDPMSIRPDEMVTFQRQLRAALDKFAEMNHKFLNRTKKGQPVLTQEQAEQSLALIQDIRSEIDKMNVVSAKELKISVEEAVSARPDLNFVMLSGESIDVEIKEVKDLKESKDIKEARETKEARESKETKETKERKEAFEIQQTLPEIEKIESPLDYLKLCHNAIQSNIKNYYIDAALQDIESMILAFDITPPKSDAYWKKLNFKDAKEALNIFQSILRMYGNLCYLKGGHPFGQRWLTSASAMVIAGKIANSHFEQNKLFSNLSGYIKDNITNTDVIKDTAGTTRDPRFDTRYEELKKMVEELRGEAGEKYKFGGMSGYEGYDLEILEKYKEKGIKRLLELAEKDSDARKGIDEIDKARIILYKIAQGKYPQEVPAFRSILEDLEFCAQFNQFAKECRLFETGEIDIFKTISFNTEITMMDRLKHLTFEHRAEPSSINFTRKSNFTWSHGVTVPAGFALDLMNTYNIQDPLIKDQLFAKKYLPASVTDYRAEVFGEYNFDPSEAVLHFDKLTSTLDKRQYPSYPSRTLPFTRVNRNSRAIATLDFFESNLEMLNDKDKQQFFILNVLTPKVFLNQIEKSPMIADRFVSLIENGLKFHTRGNQIEPGGYFCLTMSYYLLKYLKTSQHKEKFGPAIQRLERLEKWIQDVEEDHKKYLEAPSLDPESRKRSSDCVKDLELLTLLRNSVMLSDQRHWTLEQTRSILSGILHRTMVPGRRGVVLDPFIDEELDKQIQGIRPNLLLQLNEMPSKERHALLQEIVVQFLVPDILPDKQFTLDDQFPLLHIQHKELGTICLDLTSGVIKSSSYVYRNLPSEFYTKDFLDYFGDKEFKGKVFMTATRRVAEFEDVTLDPKTNKTVKHLYRVILDDRGKSHIQTKLMKVQGKDQWYELQNTTNIRGHLKEPLKSSNKLIPRHFLEKEKFLWASVEAGHPTQYYITNRNQEFYAEITKNARTPGVVMDTYFARDLSSAEHQIFQMTPKGESTGYYLIEFNSKYKEATTPQTRRSREPEIPSLLKQFAQFEDPQFIEVWKKDRPGADEAPLKILLPRYGLEFAVRMVQGWPVLHCLNKPGFIVASKNYNSFGNLENVLYLENPKTNERLALVPKQEFYPLDENEAEYQKLKLDTDHGIAPALVTQKPPSESEEEAAPKEKPVLEDSRWRFTQTEQFVTFKLDPENNPTSLNTVDLLYLAYIYLAKHQAEKAYAILEKIDARGGIKGEAEEVEWIQRIMSEIPNSLYDDKLYQKAKTNEPDTLAARVKAAFLLADYKNKNFDQPKFDLSLPKGLETITTYNDLKERQKRERLVNFYKSGFLEDARNYYADYFKTRGIVPEHMQLSPKDELSLLNQMFKATPREKAFGFVAGRQKELELIQLNSEALTLRKKLAKKGTLSAQDSKRLKRIDETLKAGNPYLVAHGKIKSMPVRITPRLPELTKKDIDLLSNERAFRYAYNKPPLTVLQPSELDLGTPQDNILYSFENLYNLARLPKKVVEQDIKQKKEMEALSTYLGKALKMWAESEAPAVVNKSNAFLIILAYIQQYPELNWPPFPNERAPTFEVRIFLESLNETLAKVIAQKPLLTVSSVQYVPEEVTMRAFIGGPRQASPAVETVHVSPVRGPAYVSPDRTRADEKERKEKSDQKIRSESSRTDISESISASIPAPSIKEFLKPIAPKDKFVLCNAVEIPAIQQYYQSILSVKPKEAETKQFLETKGAKESKETKEAEDQFYQSELKNFNEDYQSGVQLNSEIRIKRELTKNCFKSQATRDHLKSVLSNSIAKEKEELTALQKKIVLEANAALSGPKAGIKAKLKAAAGRKPLQFNELLTLFLQDDLNAFEKRTGLDRESVIKLSQHIHEFLLQGTAHKQKARVQKALDQLGKKTESDPKYESEINALVDQLAIEQSYEAHLYPEMLVFEYLDDKMIRGQQVKMITDLLERKGDGYVNKVIQMIMGGGKSKVIMPLLALLKANGSNLSILEVPPSLFETNLADMQAVSQSLFGQKGYPFWFKRDMELQSSDLRTRLQQLKQVIVNKGYVITTAESIQSLELKYLELLAAPPSPDDLSESGKEAYQEWEKQVQYMDKMLVLLKTRGDVLIDEIDSTLDPKKELNFTIGGDIELPEPYLKTLLDLFELLPDTLIKVRGEQISLDAVMKRQKTLSTPEEWEMAMEAILDQIIQNPKSPLAEWMATLRMPGREGDLKLFKEYMLEGVKKQKIGAQKPGERKTVTVPAFIKDMPDLLTRSKIGLLKAEMEVLPMTLQRKPNEHFGFPKDPLTAISMELAIPFLANNTPNERSQFGSYIETINFTIQLQKQRELMSLPVLKEFIEDFYTLANREVTESTGQLQFEETEAFYKFKEITGMNLNNIDPRNVKQLLQWQKTVSDKSDKSKAEQNKKIIDYCLLHYVLKKVKEHRSILKSDGTNHISQFRSAQGMTGTPWNYRCYNPKLIFNPLDSKGVDGQTLDHLLSKDPITQNRDPKVTVTRCLDTNPAKIIASMLRPDHPKIERMHGFIDVGALFNGTTNEAIARSMAKQLAKRADNKIKIVLYFDEDQNELYGMPVYSEAVEDSQIKPIRIGSSDLEVINEKTGTTPAERFTYYDQRHTTGTDINQTPDAISLITVDKRTLARDFLQGAMRMRGLGSTQGLEVILPSNVLDTAPSNTEWDIKQVATFVIQNQLSRLAELHHQGAIQNMNNVLRENFLNRFYSTKSAKEKAKLYQAFDEIFLTKGAGDPFTQFGHIETLEDTKRVFDTLVSDQLKRWEDTLRDLPKKVPGASPVAFSEPEKQAIKDELMTIAENAKKYCLSQCKKVLKTHENAVMVQKEKEKEKEKERLKELMQMRKGEAASIAFVPHVKWDFGLNPAHLDLMKECRVQVFPLNKMLETSSEKPTWRFDPNLFVSENFMNTYRGQRDKMDYLRKPVNFFLVIQDPPPSTGLRTLVVTPEEADEFGKMIQTHQQALNRNQRNYWVLTTHDSVRDSTTPPPLPFTHPDFSRIKEQVCYFNADLDVLSENPGQMGWFLNDSKDKIKYLETTILPHYPEKKQSARAILDVLHTSALTRDLDAAIQAKEVKQLKEVLKGVKSIPYQRKRARVLNSLNKKGLTLLGAAIQSGYGPVIEALLAEPDIDLIKIDSQGRVPLTIALQMKNSAIIKQLLNDPRTLNLGNKIKAWETLIAETIKQDNMAVFKQMMEKIHTLPQDIQKSVDAVLIFQLIKADEAKHLEVLIKEMPRLGSEVTDQEGNTPLEMAILQSKQGIVQLFLKDPKALPPRDDEAKWEKLLNKLLKTNNVDMIPSLLKTFETQCDEIFLGRYAIEKLGTAISENNTQQVRALLNYLSQVSPKLELSEWKDQLLKIVQSGNINVLSVFSEITRKQLDDRMRTELYREVDIDTRKGRVPESWLVIALPKPTESVEIQKRKKEMFMQLLKDPQFTVDSSDSKTWRKILEQAVHLNDPDLVKALIIKINSFKEMSERQQIVEVGHPGRPGFGGPLVWATQTELPGKVPEIEKQNKQQIMNMFSAIPHPASTETSKWYEILSILTTTKGITADNPLLEKLSSFGRQNPQDLVSIIKYKKVIPGMISGDAPLPFTAIENLNLPLYHFLISNGADPAQKDINQNTILHILGDGPVFANIVSSLAIPQASKISPSGAPLTQSAQLNLILQDPRIDVNALNVDRDTVLLRLLRSFGDESTMAKLSNETFYRNWMSAIATLVNRPDTDVSIKDVEGQTALQVVASLPYPSNVKKELTALLENRLKAKGPLLFSQPSAGGEPAPLKRRPTPPRERP